MSRLRRTVRAGVGLRQAHLRPAGGIDTGHVVRDAGETTILLPLAA